MLDRVTIERILANAGQGPVVLALSGGGDSVALMRLLAAELGADKIKAVVVDHALRDGSAADAVRAYELAHAVGVDARIVTLDWSGLPRPAQQPARRARYRALCQTARALGARVIALGHTLDDQAETVLMRAASGSGWRGLAGMALIAPAPVWPEGRGIVLARPLLGVRRAELRAYLQSYDAAWIDDPANTNPAFERVRVRGRLAILESAGLAPQRVAAMSARLRARADVVDEAAKRLIKHAVRFEGPRLVVDPEGWDEGEEAGHRALSVLLMAVSGTEKPPETSALGRLHSRMLDKGFSGAALGGARIAPRRGTLMLTRDLGAVMGRAGGHGGLKPLSLPVDEEVVWDGRLALRADAGGWTVEPGSDGAPILVRDSEHARIDGPGAPVRAEWLVEARAKHLLAFD